MVDEQGWDIPHDDDVEMDQYDNPHTYMLRDALKGKLIDSPPSVMVADIKTNQMWECTRLVMSSDVATHADRSRAGGHGPYVAVTHAGLAPTWF